MRRRMRVEYHDYLDELIARKRVGARRRPRPARWSTPRSTTSRSHQQQLHGYLMLLIGAGNETTRNATSRGVLALSSTPTSSSVLAATTPTATWSPPSRRSCAGPPRHPVRPHRDRRTSTCTARRSGPGDTVGHLVPVGQPRRAPVRRAVPLRRGPRPELPRRPSATGPTSAWAPTWPAGSSGRCSVSSPRATCWPPPPRRRARVDDRPPRRRPEPPARRPRPVMRPQQRGARP